MGIDFKTIKRFEKVSIGLLIGSIFPLFLSTMSVVIWIYFDKNIERPLVYVVAGFVCGLLIDWKFLKSWINNRYDLPLWFVSSIYIFYNVWMFGLFMGVPVFHVLLGAVAGYYSGKRIKFKNISSDYFPEAINKTAMFTAVVMALVCILSGIIAFADESTGGNIQGMFGLGFKITKPMILGITVVGGVLLVSIVIMLTRITMSITIKFKE